MREYVVLTKASSEIPQKNFKLAYSVVIKHWPVFKCLHFPSVPALWLCWNRSGVGHPSRAKIRYVIGRSDHVCSHCLLP